MKSLFSSISVTSLILILLFGCSTGTTDNLAKDSIGKVNQSDDLTMDIFEGIVLEIDEPTILISTISSLDNRERVFQLLVIGIDHEAKVGDKVKIGTTGAYEESNPAQGVATKIEVISKHN
ncbi:DUF3221 domain-containing protein [Bacillus horti]|uniref:DUF3221 domain-containing protein n=1 Tax=Caldalkalibacillus horti TaxID=77523 RepID=A0ABT9W3E5_9BACI|nr:DUF3221 domain-containing protein [Bacillus horti]MDQ0167759.1 hypothetical protein [Bacillus horti]